jgi:NADH-quinone oxidoreductase subunit L
VPALAPVVEWSLLAAAVAIALAGMLAAWRLLPFERLVPARQAPAERGIGRLLWKRYYVDELYDRLLVRPIVWVSRRVLWGFVDRGAVDGAGVNGTARIAEMLGWVGSRLQTGELGLYVALFVAGAVLLLGAVR